MSSGPAPTDLASVGRRIGNYKDGAEPYFPLSHRPPGGGRGGWGVRVPAP